MPLYVYRCEVGHVEEKLVRSFQPRHQQSDELADTSQSSTCSCGLPSHRDGVTAFAFTGFAATPDGQRDFSQDYRRFREASEQLDSNHKRNEERAQQPLESPRLYQAARQEAKRLTSLGVTTDTYRS